MVIFSELNAIEYVRITRNNRAVHAINSDDIIQENFRIAHANFGRTKAASSHSILTGTLQGRLSHESIQLVDGQTTARMIYSVEGSCF